MQVNSAEILEFESLRKLVGRFIASPLGRRELHLVQPIADRARLEEIHAENAEAIEYVRAASQPQAASRGAVIRVKFNNIPDTAEAVGKLHIEGAVLDPRQIYDIGLLLDQAAEARNLISAVGGRFPRLSQRAERIGDFKEVLRSLDGKVLADGTVADER
jgi:DNA mismatch repair protein MutS2